MSFNEEIREEVSGVKKEVKELQEKSVAYEMIHDQRLQNKRIFIVLILVIILWFITVGVAFYLFIKGGFKIQNITGDNSNITDRA